MLYNQPIGAGTNAPYVDGNPGAGIEGSAVPAKALEHPQREIMNVITGSGLVPDGNDLTQLYQAMKILGAPIRTGLTISELVPANNVADAVNDLDFTAGACVSDDRTTDIFINTAMTKRLDAVWAPGTNQGGRSGAALADGTWHAFAISKDKGVDADIYFDTSSNPTLPAGYTKKRRIFSFRRVSGSIYQFYATESAGGGLCVENKARTTTFAKAISTSTANIETLSFVPAAIDLYVCIAMTLQQATAGGSLFVAHENSNACGILNTVSNGNGITGSTLISITNARAKMYSVGGSSMTVTLTEMSYLDSRV